MTIFEREKTGELYEYSECVKSNESGKYDASDKSESGERGASGKSGETGESGDARSQQTSLAILCYILFLDNFLIGLDVTCNQKYNWVFLFMYDNR